MLASRMVLCKDVAKVVTLRIRQASPANTEDFQDHPECVSFGRRRRQPWQLTYRSIDGRIPGRLAERE